MIVCKYSKYSCIKNRKGGDIFSPFKSPNIYLSYVANYAASDYLLLTSVSSYNYTSFMFVAANTRTCFT